MDCAASRRPRLHRRPRGPSRDLGVKGCLPWTADAVASPTSGDKNRHAFLWAQRGARSHGGSKLASKATSSSASSPTPLPSCALRPAPTVTLRPHPQAGLPDSRLLPPPRVPQVRGRGEMPS